MESAIRIGHPSAYSRAYTLHSTPANPSTPILSNVRGSRHLLHYRNVYLRMDNSKIQRQPQLPQLGRPCAGALHTLPLHLDNSLRDGVLGGIPSIGN
jgi:hypothetical protein